MRLSAKSILLVSPEPWDHLFVSKHHYAIHLARRGNDVYFLNPPGKNTSVVESDQKGLTIISYNGFPRGMRYYPSVFSKWITRRVFDRLESIAKVKFDVIWSFDNSVFYQFDALPSSIFKISHIVDLNQNFETKSAAKSANVCFGVISPIVERLKLHNPSSFKVGHGLNVSLNSDFNLVVPDSNDIRALYLGNLAMSYLDWENLYKTALKHSNVDFIFIGSNGDNFDLEKNVTHDSKLNISKLENVFFHNTIPASAIHSVISKADLLMISYQEKFHLDQSNSHKVLEYLYSGKPIVATFTQEYEGKDLMYMSHNNAEWPSIFEYVINNIEVCSSKELADKRKNYALEHTYDKQIDRIEKLLASLPA